MSELSENAAPGLRRLGLAVAVVAIAVVAFGTIARWRENNSAVETAAAQVIPTVRLIAPTAAGNGQNLTLPATLEAWTSARIFARVPGYVKAWYRDIGANVGAGTPLGAIDTPELDQQIIEANASVARAKTEFDLARITASRWSDLLKTASVSQQEADEKNGAAAARGAALREARAALGRLLAMKSYATVRAPFAGIVTARNADIGDLVGPGATAQQPLFAMADEHRIRVYVNVPQQYSAAIHPGLTASLTVPEYPGRTFTASVIGISGAIDSHSGTLQVQLALDNTGGTLRAGDYAQVRFDLPGAAGGVTIPASALVLGAGGSQVATVDAANHVHLLRVVPGHDMGSNVEIASGLPPGTRIIDNPPDSIAEGELVHVAPHD